LLIFPRLAGGDAQVHNLAAVGEVAGFRVAAKIADDDYFVD